VTLSLIMDECLYDSNYKSIRLKDIYTSFDIIYIMRTSQLTA